MPTRDMQSQLDEHGSVVKMLVCGGRGFEFQLDHEHFLEQEIKLTLLHPT